MPSLRVEHALGATAPARWLHPLAWWAWALGMAAAASRTSNPLALIAIIIVVGVVVSARRPDTPWSRSFAFLVALGVMVIAMRLLLQILLGAASGGPVLFTLPEVPLPELLVTVRLGGPVTSGAVLLGLYDGLRLAALLACIGAASSLASPSRMLKAVPAALYEVGVVLVVALTFVPQLVSDLWRVRQMQRLRGRPARGLHGWRSAAMPVVNGGLERSVTLAAAMDSRGYGRRADVPPRIRRLTQGLLLGGLFGVVLGIFGLLSSGQTTMRDIVLMLGGSATAMVGLVVAGQRSPRTRYRPDPWALPEWLTALSGVVAAGFMVAASASASLWLHTGTVPAQWPDLPLLAAAAIGVGMLPAVVTPQVPLAVRRKPRLATPSHATAWQVDTAGATGAVPGAAS